MAALVAKAPIAKKRKIQEIESDDEPLSKKTKKVVKKTVKVKATTKGKKTPDKKKKSTSSKKTKTTVKRTTKTTTKKAKTENGRKLKILSKMETLEMAIKARRWWNDEPLPEGIAWRSLAHNGVLFPPPYKVLPSNVKLYYDGQPVDLTPEQEEMAYFYAAMPLDGPQLGNPKTAAVRKWFVTTEISHFLCHNAGLCHLLQVFNKNFFKDFKALLGKGHAIREFSKCDFTAMRKYLVSTFVSFPHQSQLEGR